MPPVKSEQTQKRSQPYPSVTKPTKCREETCDRVPQPPMSAKTFRKTGRCRECAAKYGIGLIRELLDDSHENDTDELLALSVMIAIKFRKISLNDNDRRYFASTFRNIANQIEFSEDTHRSLWDAFLGRKASSVKSNTRVNV